MAELLKDMFNSESLREFALQVQKAYPPFSVEKFLSSTMDETWPELELKARGRQITLNLAKYLPRDYPETIAICDQIAPNCSGFLAMVFSDFVEVFGQDEKYLDISIPALGRYTSYCSSEFAVRPFIINYEERMMAQMYEWSKDESEHRRRLASEGCRPLLPWGQVLPKYKNDPSPILPILEQLKADSSLYVRKSVANNLNDISKNNPDTVVKLAQKWYGKNKDTDWIVKHGCRTLLKKGNREVLTIFGYHDASEIEVTDFKLHTFNLGIGEELTFSFAITAKEVTKVRLEYGIDYVKANGKRNRKIFQLSELSLDGNKRKIYKRKQSFADMTTRKHYPGEHTLTLFVNGMERETANFHVK